MIPIATHAFNDSPQITEITGSLTPIVDNLATTVVKGGRFVTRELAPKKRQALARDYADFKKQLHAEEAAKPLSRQEITVERLRFKVGLNKARAERKLKQFSAACECEITRENIVAANKYIVDYTQKRVLDLKADPCFVPIVKSFQNRIFILQTAIHLQIIDELQAAVAPERDPETRMLYPERVAQLEVLYHLLGNVQEAYSKLESIAKSKTYATASTHVMRNISENLSKHLAELTEAMVPLRTSPAAVLPLIQPVIDSMFSHQELIAKFITLYTLQRQWFDAKIEHRTKFEEAIGGKMIVGTGEIRPTKAKGNFTRAKVTEMALAADINFANAIRPTLIEYFKLRAQLFHPHLDIQELELRLNNHLDEFLGRIQSDLIQPIRDLGTKEPSQEFVDGHDARAVSALDQSTYKSHTELMNFLGRSKIDSVDHFIMYASMLTSLVQLAHPDCFLERY